MGSRHPVIFIKIENGQIAYIESDHPEDCYVIVVETINDRPTAIHDPFKVDSVLERDIDQTLDEYKDKENA